MKILSPLLSYFNSTGKMKAVGAVEGEFSKTIVLPITNIQNSFTLYFNPDNELSNSVIRSIELLTTTNVSVVQKNGQNYDNLSAGQAAGGILVLSNVRREILASFPLATIVRSTNQGKATFTNFSEVSWDSCFVFFPSPVAAANTYAVTVRVYFDKKI
jgi:hypothetical protein